MHKNLIDGEWVEGDASPNINPSDTSEIVGQYARASEEDTRRDRGGEDRVAEVVALRSP